MQAGRVHMYLYNANGAVMQSIKQGKTTEDDQIVIGEKFQVYSK